jgi:hypothetical protein
MQRAVLPLLFGVGFCLSALSAQADIDYYEVANLTLSGGVLNIPYGSGDYPVATDVTFTNLNLQETFGNGTVTDTIINGGATLDTTTFTLDSAQFDTTADGGLISATLTGNLSTNSLDVYNQALPNTGTTTVTTTGSFSATLTGAAAGSFVNLYDTDGQTNYALGTLSLINVGPSQTTVPEPGLIGLLAAGGVSLLGLARRRARRA